MREYTLMFDESGDHYSVHPEDVSKRYLGLVGVAIRRDQIARLGDWLERFKSKHIPAHSSGRPVILVRNKIVQQKGAFYFLQDEDKRASFDNDSLLLFERFPYRIFAVVLDKYTHTPREYRRMRHPYHYALHALMERYCGWLRYCGGTGDIVAEARGKLEDGELREAYNEVYTTGTVQGYLSASEAQRTLSSDRIGIKNKKDNDPGLQLADLLANSLTRDVLVNFGHLEEVPGVFGKQLVATVQGKYNLREGDGRIDGYGRVLLK